MKLRATFILITILSISIVNSYGQDNQLNEIKQCLSAGNSTDLNKYLDGVVEVGVDGSKKSYNKSQASFVLRDFFKKSPPTSFNFVHKGESKGGLVYSIGRYESNQEKYRVLVRMKEESGTFKIYNINFTKE